MPQSPGKIITFYSYKGGAGRSMTLANVAWILACSGKRVLVVDWDLEAPGLHRYFRPFLIDADLIATPGIIDCALSFAVEVLTPALEPAQSGEWYKNWFDIDRYTASLVNWKFPEGAALDFLPAGKQGLAYSISVNSFDWRNFYDRLGGVALLDVMRETMRSKYDFVLIDSRTGVSDTAGICTVHMPDVLVTCFMLNHQAIDGAAAVARDVNRQRSVGAGRSQPEQDAAGDVANSRPIKILPVPMRVENAEKEKLEARRRYAEKKFEHFLTPTSFGTLFPNGYLWRVAVPYVPYYAYEEVLAAFMDRSGDGGTVLAAALELARLLADDDKLILKDPSDEERERVRALYSGLNSAPERVSTVVEKLDGLYEHLPSDDGRIMQQLCMRLLQGPIRGVRRDQRWANARGEVRFAGLDANSARVLAGMTRTGAVTITWSQDAQQQVAVFSDESIVLKWDRLRNWIDEGRHFNGIRERLQRVANRR